MLSAPLFKGKHLLLVPLVWTISQIMNGLICSTLVIINCIIILCLRDAGVRIPAKKNPVSVNNHIEAKSIGVQHKHQEKSSHLHSHGSPLTGQGSNKTRHDGENQEVILVGSMNSEQKSGIVVPLDKGSPNCPSTFSENGDSNLGIHDRYFEHVSSLILPFALLMQIYIFMF